MILVQTILLKVALDNRPPTGVRAGLEHVPFSAYSHEGIIQQIQLGKRPYQFWQWPTPRPCVLEAFCTFTDVLMLIHWLNLQILSIPSLFHPMPLHHSHIHTNISDLLCGGVHRLPWLCWAGD